MGDGSLKIVKLYGGLGNQLFQYAFGCFLRKQGYQVRYYSEPHISVSTFDIEKIFHNILFADDIQLSSLNYTFFNRLQYRICRSLWRRFPGIRPDVLVENGSQYQNDVLHYRIYDGYWQSWRYITQEFSEKLYVEVSKMAQDSCYNNQLCSENTVLLHIRRGDYLRKDNRLLFASVDSTYYSSAIQYMCNHVADPVFYVFSDDIVWAREEFSAQLLVSDNIRLVFIDESDTLRSFSLMSACQHAIIPNSTFSWWAAWLISNSDKIVISPKQWYLDNKMNANTCNLIPSDWLRM